MVRGNKENQQGGDEAARVQRLRLEKALWEEELRRQVAEVERLRREKARLEKVVRDKEAIAAARR